MTRSAYEMKLLHVDLTRRKCEVQKVDDEDAQKFVGGAGLAAAIVWEKTKRDTEPLSPDNPFCMMAGPVSGTAPLSSKYAVGTVSPLTGIWGQAHGSGDWADELKHTGFTGIVVEGRADNPVYLWIHNGNAEIRDASHIWGVDTYEVESVLRMETDGNSRVACIGRAGENMVKIAAVMSDGMKARAAARCGVGAVMGSKNLKAVVVRGSQALQVLDPRKVSNVAATIYKISPVERDRHSLERGHRSEVKDGGVMIGAPVRNWLGGTGPHVGPHPEATLHFCRRCPYSCVESLTMPEGDRAMVYQHTVPLGTACLINDQEALQEMYRQIGKYGMDTISFGNIVAFAMECYERGLLTIEDTDGLDLRFGNTRAAAELVRKIGEREGIGAVLAEGVRKAAETIGGLAPEYAIHVKGLELPYYDPRVYFGNAVAYATGSFGGCHYEALHSRAIEGMFAARETWKTGVPELGYPNLLDPYEWKGKAEMVAKTQHLGSMMDSLVLCCFINTHKIPPSVIAELLAGVTGWDVDLKSFLQTGERIYNLKRMINVRRGISRKDDTLPPRVLSSTSGLPKDAGSNPSLGNLPPLGAMLHEFYAFRDWTDDGVPTERKLRELGLDRCLSTPQVRQSGWEPAPWNPAKTR